jgi:hypothetical protein
VELRLVIVALGDGRTFPREDSIIDEAKEVSARSTHVQIAHKLRAEQLHFPSPRRTLSGPTTRHITVKRVVKRHR